MFPHDQSYLVALVEEGIHIQPACPCTNSCDAAVALQLDAPHAGHVDRDAIFNVGETCTGGMSASFDCEGAVSADQRGHSITHLHRGDWLDDAGRMEGGFLNRPVGLLRQVVL